MLSPKRYQYVILLCTFFTSVFFEISISIAQTDSKHYRIGPNDVLNIFVWKEAELSRDITVMSDGRISLPLIGTVMAEGKTVSELRELISQKLKNFIDAPEVTVILNQSSSRIYTIGNVASPGPYPLFANMTVLQALSTAGGLTEWADTKNILIIRRQAGKEVQYKFNYKEFIDGKKPEQNIILQPDDTVVIP